MLYALGEATGLKEYKDLAKAELSENGVNYARLESCVQIVTDSDGCSYTRYGSAFENMEKLK